MGGVALVVMASFSRSPYDILPDVPVSSDSRQFHLDPQKLGGLVQRDEYASGVQQSKQGGKWNQFRRIGATCPASQSDQVLTLGLQSSMETPTMCLAGLCMQESMGGRAPCVSLGKNGTWERLDPAQHRMNWWWKPSDCDLPRRSPDQARALLANGKKSVLLIGDSTMRQVFGVMSAMLSGRDDYCCPGSQHPSTQVDKASGVNCSGAIYTHSQQCHKLHTVMECPAQDCGTLVALYYTMSPPPFHGMSFATDKPAGALDLPWRLPGLNVSDFTHIIIGFGLHQLATHTPLNYVASVKVSLKFLNDHRKRNSLVVWMGMHCRNEHFFTNGQANTKVDLYNQHLINGALKPLSVPYMDVFGYLDAFQKEHADGIDSVYSSGDSTHISETMNLIKVQLILSAIEADPNG
eukprot:gene4248-770_t